MKKLFVFLVVALLAITACAPKAENTAETKAMVQSMVDEIWNKGNLDKAEEYFAASYLRHNPSSTEQPEIQGLEAFKEFVTTVRTIYPDFNVKVDEIIVEGDMLASRWTVTGTHNEADKQISVSGINITHYAEGKAVEEWVSFDTHSVMQQIGMVPTVQTTEK